MKNEPTIEERIRVAREGFAERRKKLEEEDEARIRNSRVRVVPWWEALAPWFVEWVLGKESSGEGSKGNDAQGH